MEKEGGGKTRGACVCIYVCMGAHVRACGDACLCVGARAGVCVRVCVYVYVCAVHVRARGCVS